MVNMTDSKSGDYSNAKATTSRKNLNLSNDESAKSLEFNNLFNSGTLKKEIEEAKNMTK
jgi:hypothetical protein